MKKLFTALMIGNLAFGAWVKAQIPAEALVPRLRYHVYYLADDSLAGRQTGSKGEQMAADYLIKQFNDIGLQPAGDQGDWKQAFSFTGKQEFGKENRLQLGSMKPKWSAGFFTLPQSGSGKVQGQLVDVGYGISNAELKHDDYAGKGNLVGKVFLMQLYSPDGSNPHGAFGADAAIERKLKLAAEKGAIGVVFYPGSEKDPLPNDQLDRRSQQQSLPALCLRWEQTTEAKRQLGKQAKLQTQIIRHQITGHNVIGYLDRGAVHTVVIGAHYDHLGHAEYGSSLHAGERAIHNGADDNASGTAALVELARYFGQSKSARYNFLFMAFSGEELGLLGSAYFAKNPTIPLESVAAMLNMDMVGKLDSQSRQLGVLGIGTSPVWPALVQSQAGDLKLKTSASGTGASDHTSFYLKDIPVLHLFTGTHSDYHKPSDDAEKLNYAGMADVVNYIIRVVNGLESGDKLPFTKTNDEDSRNAPRFKVTLGIMPDYFYEGRGIKVDGVTAGRPAAKAGVKQGDLLLELGDYELADMQAYMRALAAFEKGQQTTLVLIRGGETLKLPLEF
ncbi:MAG: hypothetical protein C0424_05120 [Sphingobacteriaceae bacterium]|nr:hypothetical protein [Sphingobacteriaceae bacterium]